MAAFLTATSSILLVFFGVCGSETLYYVSDMLYFEAGSIIGYVNFTQERGNPVKIAFNLTGLPPGKHGVHVHEFGSIRNNCTLAGGHFNPYNMQHGAPNDTDRHVGDLGNIDIPDCSDPFLLVLEDNIMSLFPGNNSVVSRVLAIHANEDDLGRGDNAASKINGNSGARIACGVIGIAPP